MSEEELTNLHAKREFLLRRISEETTEKKHALGEGSTLVANYQKALGVVEAQIFDAEMAAVDIPLRVGQSGSAAVVPDPPHPPPPGPVVPFTTARLPAPNAPLEDCHQSQLGSGVQPPPPYQPFPGCSQAVVLQGGAPPMYDTRGTVPQAHGTAAAQRGKRSRSPTSQSQLQQSDAAGRGISVATSGLLMHPCEKTGRCPHGECAWAKFPRVACLSFIHTKSCAAPDRCGGLHLSEGELAEFRSGVLSRATVEAVQRFQTPRAPLAVSTTKAKDPVALTGSLKRERNGKDQTEKIYHVSVYNALNVPASDTEPVPGHSGYVKFKPGVWEAMTSVDRAKFGRSRLAKASDLGPGAIRVRDRPDPDAGTKPEVVTVKLTENGEDRTEKIYHVSVYNALNVPASDTEPVPGHLGYVKFKQAVWDAKATTERGKFGRARAKKSSDLGVKVVAIKVKQ